MRYDGEHKAKTRARVIAEASTAIRTEGVDRIGVAAIMARVGLTHGGFYAHFASKDELITAAIGHMFDDRYARFLAHDASDPSETLRHFIDSYLSMRHRDNPGAGCPIPALSASTARLPETARVRFVAGVTQLTAGVARQLAATGLDDADAAAASAVAELVGALGMSRATDDRDHAERLLAASRASVSTRLGLN